MIMYQAYIDQGNCVLRCLPSFPHVVDNSLWKFSLDNAVLSFYMYMEHLVNIQVPNHEWFHDSLSPMQMS